MEIMKGIRLKETESERGIQFYVNRGKRCAQTTIKSLVTEDRIPYKQLDKLTGRGPKQITTPIQIAYALQKLEVDFLYLVKPFFINEGINELRERTKKEFGEYNYKRTNFEFIMNARERLRQSENYSLQNSFTLDSISNYLDPGKVPLILINYDIFVGREDKKSGHYLILHDVSEQYAQIMDCGPYNAHPNKQISRKRLDDSWMQTPLDYGVILV